MQQPKASDLVSFSPRKIVISPYWITSPPRIVLAAAYTTPVFRCPSMAWDHQAIHRLNPNPTHGSFYSVRFLATAERGKTSDEITNTGASGHTWYARNLK